MNQITSCPMCHGQGRILITDYVDRLVKRDWPIQCPVCTGLGMIRGVGCVAAQ
jgi:hypothetical protein